MNEDVRVGDRETVDGVVYVVVPCRGCGALMSIAEAALNVNVRTWLPLCGKCAR